MSRTQTIQQLENEVFDLCVIGGGASGAGCAYDAALRGLKVALIERDDFASGTSSRSTKLIHGGVRYLEQAFKRLDFKQLKQVIHGLQERHIVLSAAPHLARPLALLTPVYSWVEGLYYTIGLKIYGFIASGKDTLPPSQWLSHKETLRRLPGLNPKIHSSVLYYDGQLDDARYCLAIAQSAAEAGASVLNHAELLGFERDGHGKLSAATIADVQSSAGNKKTIRLRARQFLNCCGPFADAVRHAANAALPKRIQASKGVHAVLPQELLGGDDALLIPKTNDGRVIFAIPFQGKLMVGTTDDPYLVIEQEPVLEPAELDFLVETLQRFTLQKIDKQQVVSGFGGLRPLIVPLKTEGRNTKNMLRDHEVEHDPKSGLLSLLGGKWTTYRLMAKDAVDAACQLLQHEATCRTEHTLLYGAAGYNEQLWRELQNTYSLTAESAKHLAQNYGGCAGSVCQLFAEDEALRKPIVANYPFLCAEIAYCARHEMACTLRDFLARRIRLEITDWAATTQAAPIVAEWMGLELGWSKEVIEESTNAYISQIESFEQIIVAHK